MIKVDLNASASQVQNCFYVKQTATARSLNREYYRSPVYRIGLQNG